MIEWFDNTPGLNPSTWRAKSRRQRKIVVPSDGWV